VTDQSNQPNSDLASNLGLMGCGNTNSKHYNPSMTPYPYGVQRNILHTLLLVDLFVRSACNEWRTNNDSNVRDCLKLRVIVDGSKCVIIAFVLIPLGQACKRCTSHFRPMWGQRPTHDRGSHTPLPGLGEYLSKWSKFQPSSPSSPSWRIHLRLKRPF
jgi:hypothetical protein